MYIRREFVAKVQEEIIGTAHLPFLLLGHRFLTPPIDTSRNIVLLISVSIFFEGRQENE
jgi:hypothetical protein